MLHLDADCAWGERSMLVEDFHASILASLPTASSNVDLGRLLCIFPHRHVEAWCHQNLDALRDLARKPAEHALIDAWAADRAALDRHPNPKDAFSFKNAHNLTLAQSGWPRPQVVQAGASFAHTVVGWAWSRAVVELIEG